MSRTGRRFAAIRRSLRLAELEPAEAGLAQPFRGELADVPEASCSAERE
ncbi:MAG TPA: hypothetical protein VEM39_05725 [Myxococcaceae bacterium]|nr:hypothetical protein [Myxococcaceae bacterium]